MAGPEARIFGNGKSPCLWPKRRS